MKLPYLLLIPCFALAGELSKDELNQIGLKVWQNECRSTVDGLITWNASEEFPSLGLGHFIWYPEKAEKKFDETFPALIDFMTPKLKEKEKDIPSWIKSKKGFPWKTREAFLNDIRSKKVQQLRDLLSDTLDLQILFLLERFKLAEEKLLPELTVIQKAQLEALKSSSQGAYALIDYVNFKGTGLSLKERYRGHGWGLLQVLQAMPEDTPKKELVHEFTWAAKKTLARRVKNAPTERKEERYINGWHKRLETYISNK